MSRLYALLQPDGSLLTARPKGSGWAIGKELRGLEGRGRNLTVFVNGLDVLGLTVSIPARSENEARRAAPFAVEDDLAESVEASHVALAAPNKSAPAADRALNIVSRACMDEWIARLASRGLDEANIVAAHSLLPQGNVLYEAPGLVLGRIDARSFSFDATLGSDVLLSLCDGVRDLTIYGEQVANVLGQPAADAGANSIERLFVQLIGWAEAGHGIALRQGRYEARRQIDLDGIGRWKLAGGLATATALGWFVTVLLETNAMNARANQLDELAQEFARVGWPELNGDVRQALAAAGNVGGETGQAFPSILDGSALLYDALGQVDGSELRSLRYDRARRQMTATVAFEGFADVDRVTAILNTSGLTARSGDARQSGSRVIGDLTLEAPS